MRFFFPTSRARAKTIPVYGSGDDLLICCSAANRREGSFDFYKALADFPARRIYINTPDNSFYHRGAYGLGRTIPAVVRTLRAKIEMEAPKRVHIVGASMGGYAALLFGALLRLGTAVAFNAGYQLPVAVLGQEVINRKLHDARFVDLFDVIRETMETRFYVVNSDHFPRDLHQAIGLSALPNVRVLLHRGGHDLLDVLKHIDLLSAVRLLIDGDAVEFSRRTGARELPPLPQAFMKAARDALDASFMNDRPAPEGLLDELHAALPDAGDAPAAVAVDDAAFA